MQEEKIKPAEQGGRTPYVLMLNISAPARSGSSGIHRRWMQPEHRDSAGNG